MDNSNNFVLLIKRYEQQMSVFGQKVLRTLISQWNNKAPTHDESSITHVPRVNNSRKKRVLNYIGNSESPINPSKFDDSYSDGVPKTSELVRTLNINEEYDNNIMLFDPPTTSNGNIVHDVYNNDSQDEHGGNLDIIENAGTNKGVDINWDNMFDTELVRSGEGISRKVNNDQDVFFDFEPNVACHDQLINNIVNIRDNERAKKRKSHVPTIDDVDDGVKNKKLKNLPQVLNVPCKVILDNPSSYRKEKYTKTVKNWLNNIQTIDPMIENLDHDVNDTEITTKKQIDIQTPVATSSNKSKDSIGIVIEKTVKTKKKVVQSCLANKDGVMKYRKPGNEAKSKKGTVKNQCDTVTTTKANSDNELQRNILNEDKASKVVTKKKECKTVKKKYSENDDGQKDNKENRSNNTESKITEEKGIEKKVVKEKRVKKFVAPIKSQKPVVDVSYEMISIEDHNAHTYVNDFHAVDDKTMFAVLIFTNGYCQLNNHHTDDTCVPAGIILCTGDSKFFCFKGTGLNVQNILKQLIQNNKIVCYDGRSILIYFATQLQMEINSIQMYDAKIGCCLLDPDNPPDTFTDVQNLLSYTSAYTIATECTLQKAAWYTTLLQECWLKLNGLLVEHSLWKVFEDIEMKLLPIIADMEKCGVLIDMEKLKSMEEVLLSRLKQVEQQCHKAAGKVFQINSTVQVRAIIYEELHLDDKCNLKVRETLCRGAKSTSETMLRSLTSVHPLPRLILEYRHVHKAHATFLAGISQHVKDGLVKPTWEQTAAATGRIASNNPNLQAIPKAPFSLVMFPDTEDNGSISSEVLNFRSVYIPRRGWSLVSADFKHIECRIFAYAAADASLASILTTDEDLFKLLAAKWLKKPEASITAVERERTKRLVYASLYGAGTRKLMEILDVPYEQATQVAASFNRTFPSLKQFGRAVVARCSQGGNRLATPSGRARHFPDIASEDFAKRSHAERQAVNFVVQGSAADVCKTAMISSCARLAAARPALLAQLVLQIHDELVWHVLTPHVPAAAAIIKSAMEGCGQQCGLPVRLPVAIRVGDNWAHMSDYTVP